MEQRSLDTSSQAYDRNLLSKIGGPNTPSRLSLSYASPNVAQENNTSPGAPDERKGSGSLRPLLVPERRKSSFDSSQKWPNVPASGAVSPGSYHNPLDPEFSRRHPSLTSSDSVSHRGSYDSIMFTHEEFPMEDGQLKDLNINDRSPSVSSDHLSSARAGVKRRASSPHQESTREERTSVGSAAAAGDLYHRRSLQQFPSHASPIARYPHPHHGSVSSVSSYGQRGSLASSYGLSIRSSVTSLGSERHSPNTLSPALDPELVGNMAYAAFRSTNPSPRGSLSNTSHPRIGSESVQGARRQSDDVSMQPGDGNNNPLGMLVCECCPKKPKKFATEEEMR